MTFIADSFEVFSGGNSSNTPTKPAGVGSGDFLKATWVIYDTNVLGQTLPTGWTRIHEGHNAAGGSSFTVIEAWADGAVADITFVGTTNYTVIYLAGYDGQHASTPVDSGSGAPTYNESESASASAVGTGLTVTDNGSKLVYAMIGYNTGLSAGPGGMTARETNADGVSNFYDEDVNTGATGNRTGTMAANDNWSVIMFAIRPAAGGGDQTVTASGVSSDETFGVGTFVEKEGVPGNGVMIGSGYVGEGQVGALPETALVVSPSGIATGEAHGSAVVTTGEVSVACTGVASAEAFGADRIDLNVAPSSITTAEAFGTSRFDLNVSCTGVASAEAFGTQRLDLNVSASGVATAETHGSTTVTQGGTTQDVTASAIASAEAFGSARFDLNLSPPSIASAEAFGTSRFDLNVSCTSVASTEAFGTARFDQNLTANGIATAEAHGSTTVTVGAVAITASGVATAEAFGAAIVSSATIIAPNGIASSEAFGSDRIDLNVTANGIATGEAFGAASLPAIIAPSGIATTEVFGAPALRLEILAGSVASAEAFGSHIADNAGVQSIQTTSITSAEALGGPVLTAGAVTVQAGSVASGEAHGAARIDLIFTAIAIGSGEAFGAPVLSLSIAMGTVASLEAFGSPLFAQPQDVTPAGVASIGAFGVPLVFESFGLVIFCEGVASSESVGSLVLTNLDWAERLDLDLRPLGDIELEAAENGRLELDLRALGEIDVESGTP